MIDTVPILKFVKDNIDHIVFGLAGIVVPIVLSALLEGARSLSEKRSGRR
ncbi:hypothetical protein J7E68_03410 [Microbacterium sp. ISL-103]|nr:hypothetical protein [Microbacterium sp. ISL-103]MBT2473647.1 hypothetical protein [Microbacterium sp. ISL-103]